MSYLQITTNPPYSISQWDRNAFESDKYGRSFLGVPTQRRADFAFIAHILKSLNSISGRCAVLLPNGILNRYEESEMRINMIKRDYVECVIGLGKNLFFNSPMEACILICRAKKAIERTGKVLFIDAVNRVQKEGTYSYLSDEDIATIAEAYHSYSAIDGFCTVTTVENILSNEGSLRVSRYVNKHNAITEDVSCSDYALQWVDSSKAVEIECSKLHSMIGGGSDAC